MSGSRIDYAMFVIYGYVIWGVAAYAWDWWKNRDKKRQQRDGSESDSHASQTVLEDDDTASSAA